MLKKLFHYTTINNLGLILASKEIRFSRLDKVNDPTEGLTNDFLNFASYIFVSCWTKSEDENLALWNMYTPQMRGVRIELQLPIFNSFKIDTLDNLLFSEGEIIDTKGHNFIYAGDNTPIEIIYSDDQNKLKPNIQTKTGLKTGLIGKYKRTIWQFEEELRYLLHIIPFDPNMKSENFPDCYNHLLIKNIPPSIVNYSVKINQMSFSSMKILLSPKMINGDFEIVQALVEKYNPNAALYMSNLKGLIK